VSPPDRTSTDQPELMPGLVRESVARSRKAAASKARKAAEAPIAEVDPVARVLVDLPLAHLDRPFDYAVPASMADDARPGVRVKVRFAGQDVDGFLVERRATSDHTGRLTPLRRVVSAEPVLTPAVALLSEEVARRYAGARSDVLRLAVPPRHATTEKQPSAAGEAPVVDPAAAEQAWAGHATAPAYLQHLASGGAPRAVWGAPPGADWPTLVAHAVAATRASGRGALVCVPDHADVARMDASLTAVLGPGQHVVLTADAGPARRYRDFLAVSRGAAQVVVGTRAAAFAPVRDLGLVVIWDDGDDLHAEPRAPYPHAREVLLLRAEQEETAVLVGAFARSVEAQQLFQLKSSIDPTPSLESSSRSSTSSRVIGLPSIISGLTAPRAIGRRPKSTLMGATKMWRCLEFTTSTRKTSMIPMCRSRPIPMSVGESGSTLPRAYDTKAALP
jgi:primosomal protein N' (replication factor Y)